MTQVEDAARSGRAGGSAQFGGDHLDPHRVLADAQRTQFIDRTFEGAGQRAAKIGRPDPDRPVIGLDLEGDDRACAVRVFGGTSERFVGRKGNNRRANTGYFHDLSPGGSKERDQIAFPRNGAQAPTVRGSQCGRYDLAIYFHPRKRVSVGMPLAPQGVPFGPNEGVYSSLSEQVSRPEARMM